MEFDGHGRVPMLVEAADAPRRLAVRWGDPGAALGRSLDPRRVGPRAAARRRHAAAPARVRVHRSGRSGGQHRRVAERAGRARRPARHRAVRARHPQDLAARPHRSSGSGRPSPTPSSSACGGPATSRRRSWSGTRAGGSGREGLGRFGMRIDVVERPTYLAWTWTPESGRARSPRPPSCSTPSGRSRPARTGARPCRLLETGFSRARRLRHERRRLGRQRHPRRCARSSASRPRTDLAAVAADDQDVEQGDVADEQRGARPWSAT